VYSLVSEGVSGVIIVTGIGAMFFKINIKNDIWHGNELSEYDSPKYCTS